MKLTLDGGVRPQLDLAHYGHPGPLDRGPPASMTLGPAAPIAFVSTTDPARARDFYERVLGLTFVADEGFALVFDLAGTMLRVTRVDELRPQPFTVLGWRVDGIETVVRQLAARGVAFERFPGLELDALGIWSSPSGARIAWFRDPDGNLLSLTDFGR